MPLLAGGLVELPHVRVHSTTPHREAVTAELQQARAREEP